MVKDMLTEIGELFKQDEVLRSVKTKTFKRPESLPSDQTLYLLHHLDKQTSVQINH